MSEIRYELNWSEANNAYIASSVQFPDIDWMDKDPVIALQMCRVVTRKHVEEV